MSKLIGVTIGDIQGIGIEILIKEWKRKRVKNFVLITNYILFKYFRYNCYSCIFPSLLSPQGGPIGPCVRYAFCYSERGAEYAVPAQVHWGNILFGQECSAIAAATGAAPLPQDK